MVSGSFGRALTTDPTPGSILPKHTHTHSLYRIQCPSPYYFHKKFCFAQDPWDWYIYNTSLPQIKNIYLACKYINIDTHVGKIYWYHPTVFILNNSTKIIGFNELFQSNNLASEPRCVDSPHPIFASKKHQTNRWFCVGCLGRDLIHQTNKHWN